MNAPWSDRFMPNPDAPGALHTGGVIDSFHVYADGVRERDRVQALGFDVILLYVPAEYQRRRDGRALWLLVVVDKTPANAEFQPRP